jgi:threonine synthase
MTKIAGSMHSLQRCEDCGAELSELDPATACPVCDGLLELVHPPRYDAATLRSAFASRRGALVGVDHSGIDRSGVWRYRELVLPSVRATNVVTHPEGNTPLLARERIARFANVERLLIKHEGHNPTGSFKDRGMTVAITQAKRTQARAVGCASTGNTSASLAAYAAHAGIPALVFVPAGKVALGKIAQTIAYGARTLIIRGSFDDCLDLARESSAELGIQLLNSVNPFRLEGQKTIVLELLEQLDWKAPDWIALPAGNLGNTSAFGKALREAHAIGLIDRMPRILAVQAAGAAPFAASFRNGFAERVRVEPDTIATAIRIGAPASWNRAVRAIRDSNGAVMDISDADILDAKAVIDAAGVGCEPASATSVAGVARARRDGLIADGESVVAVLTGHLLKDPETVVRYHEQIQPAPVMANRPIEIEASVAAVERVLATLAAHR